MNISEKVQRNLSKIYLKLNDPAPACTQLSNRRRLGAESVTPYTESDLLVKCSQINSRFHPNKKKFSILHARTRRATTRENVSSKQYSYLCMCVFVSTCLVFPCVCVCIFSGSRVISSMNICLFRHFLRV